MPSTIPLVRALRIASILVGGALLLWLSIEDAHVRFVLLLGAIVSLLAAAGRVTRIGFWRITASGLAATGGVTGLAAPLVAILLMAIKVGLHSHLVPDFTATQLVDVLQRTPFFAVGGTLIGLGVGMARGLLTRTSE